MRCLPPFCQYFPRHIVWLSTEEEEDRIEEIAEVKQKQIFRFEDCRPAAAAVVVVGRASFPFGPCLTSVGKLVKSVKHGTPFAHVRFIRSLRLASDSRACKSVTQTAEPAAIV